MFPLSPNHSPHHRPSSNDAHTPHTKQSGADLVKKLYKMMIATDATLVEINPLAETNDGRVVAADAKLNFDDNAEYRQKGVFAKRDLTQEDPREVRAFVRWLVID